MTERDGPSDGSLGRDADAPGRVRVLSRWWSGMGVAAKAVVLALSTLGAFSLIGASIFALVIEPRVKDVLVGESRLDVHVLVQGKFGPRGLPHSGMWLFPEGTVTPAEVPSVFRDPYGGAGPARNRWADSGGVAAETLAIRLSVRALDQTPVLLHGMRVDVVKRAEPLSGWFLVPDVACGGQAVRSVDFDLDEDPVVPTVWQSGPNGGRDRPFDLTLRVSETDPEVYEIHAQTFSHYVEFRVVYLYDSASGVGEYVVNDGQPFSVTALARDRARAYNLPYSEPPDPEAVLQRDRSRDPSGLARVGLC